MRSNFITIAIVAVLFGLAFGIYDLVLPLWLKINDISYKQMGWIYALSNGVMVIVPLITGRLSDRSGRRFFYGASLVSCGVACAVTPLTVSVFGQTILRVLQRSASGVYESLQSVLLFETDRRQFFSSIRSARGFELTCHALGAVIVMAIVHGPSGQDRLAQPLYVAAGLLAVAFVLVMLRLREPKSDESEPATGPQMSLLGLSPALLLLAAFNMMFMFGLSISHSQMMVLFFYDKFNLTEHQAAWVSIVHRLSLGVPLLLAGIWVVRPVKWLFVVSLVLEGVFIAVTVLPTSAVAAVAIWFIHDPIGAALWMPINSWYIQRYARPHRRAADAAFVLGAATLGSVFGPLVAGRLAAYSGNITFPGISGAIDLPFVASGLVVAGSAILVLLLPKVDAESQ